MGWVILSIVAIVLIVLLIISCCEVSGSWNEYEENKFSFTLICEYWIDSEEGKKYYTLTKFYVTYDKLEDELEQAIFNPYFVSAKIKRYTNGY